MIMPSTARQLNNSFASGPELREVESRSAVSISLSGAVFEENSAEKDAVSRESVARRLSHIEVTSTVTVALLYAIAVVSVWFFSLVVRVHPDQFPSGPLTPMQLTAMTLCAFTIALHLSNEVFAWLRCSYESAATVRAASEVSTYLLLFFVCDRTTLLRRRPRAFNADFFSFLVFIFVCAALATARRIRARATAVVVAGPALPTSASVHAEGDHGRPVFLPGTPAPQEAAPPTAAAAAAASLLTRHHVQEWVGWVLLLYVLYGYFHNVHIYRLIRVCVSALTFLTAFTMYARFDSASSGGELTRSEACVLLLRSLWKLNFLVVATCALLRDQYMLYHICAVQSCAAVATFLLTFVGPLPRSSHRVLGIKVAVVVVLECVLWDMPFSTTVFRHFWGPLQWVVRYDNPIVGVVPLHEWQFRSGLDHWIWLVAVLVAHYASVLAGLLRRLDSQRPAGTVIKAVVAVGAVGVLCLYGYVAEKTVILDFNRHLPYTSWVPILAFFALRCVLRSVRSFYMPLCTFLGTFAVEAYVAHNHVFLATTGPNAGPLYTLRLLPGNHPLCDFGIFTLLLLWISYRIALVTPRLRQCVLPHNATLLVVLENVALVAAVVATTYTLHYLWRSSSAGTRTF